MSHVTVIGAGLVGLATAFELTERGADVTVVDRAPAGQATHFAGGMLAPVAEVQYRQEPLYPLMLDSAVRYPDLVERVSAATDLPTGHRTDGTLVVAADRADATHLAELAAHQSAHEMTVERITVREARRLEPGLSPNLAGAVSIPGDHEVAPRQFAEALIDALRSRGVEFVAEKATALVRATENADSAVTAVRTESHTLPVADGDSVVLAAGLGASEIEGVHAPLQLRPVYGDILIAAAPHGEELITRVVRGFVEDRPIYLIPRAEGRIAIGATSREDHRADTPLFAVRDLLRDACRVAPCLEEAGMVEWGTGARPGTPDDLPYLGREGENLVISTGYFRHGILLTALGAAVGAEMALGAEAPELIAACDPRRARR